MQVKTKTMSIRDKIIAAENEIKTLHLKNGTRVKVIISIARPDYVECIPEHLINTFKALRTTKDKANFYGVKANFVTYNYNEIVGVRKA